MKDTISKPCIRDAYPDKAQYLHDEVVNIIVEVANPRMEEINVTIQMSVLDLDNVVFQTDLVKELKPAAAQNIILGFTPSSKESKGYGVDITLVYDDNIVHTCSTAFDVVSTWKEAPRYGFLSDFYKQDENDTDDIKQMVKYHLNVVQFYDWMFKHDDLVSSEIYYTDSLNRQLSLKAVRNKIDACHQYGIKALAYGAVYAASREFFEKNREAALFDNNGNAQNFGGNWLFIMNTSPESPWVEHIINEFRKTVRQLDFDGIHMDTYGFPKAAYSMLNGHKKLERLEKHFPNLINRTREQLEAVKDDIGIIFNAVSNWSVEAVAPAKQDAVYIEVWDPSERYFHLNYLINRAKELGKKPVILAAYLSAFLKENNVNPEFAENSFLLAESVIFASGGYHILLGENNGILAHPYFVKYGVVRKEFERTIRNYYDFIVRYKNLLYDLELVDVSMTHANGINDEYVFENGTFSSYGEPNKIWTIIKEKPGYKIIHLINFTGIESDIWNEGKVKKPVPVENICIKALIDEKIKKIFIASPDTDNGITRELGFEYSGHTRGTIVKFNVPMLDVWNLVYIETE